MRVEYIWIVVTALTWGGYPLITRTAGFSGPRGALILMLTGLVPIAIMAARAGGDGWPTTAGLVKLSIAGLMMGIGLISFHALAVGKMDLSVSIPTVDVAMMLVSAIGAMLFFAEPVTLQRLLGIGMLVGGIILLR